MKLTKNQKEYATKLSMQIRDITNNQVSANTLVKTFNITQLQYILSELQTKGEIESKKLGFTLKV
ncbi:MAG: hypothetical protein ACFFG0_43945 [Candidatus Thorarchaeota archaeon]